MEREQEIKRGREREWERERVSGRYKVGEGEQKRERVA